MNNNIKEQLLRNVFENFRSKYDLNCLIDDIHFIFEKCLFTIIDIDTNDSGEYIKNNLAHYALELNGLLFKGIIMTIADSDNGYKISCIFTWDDNVAIQAQQMIIKESTVIQSTVTPMKMQTRSPYVTVILVIFIAILIIFLFK